MVDKPRSRSRVACSRCGGLAPPSELTPGALSAVCPLCIITTTHPGMHAETPIDGPPAAKKPRNRKPKGRSK